MLFRSSLIEQLPVSYLARIEAVPDAAKATGNIRDWIVMQLTGSKMLPAPPEAPRTDILGWNDPSNGHVYAKGGRLLSGASLALRPVPTPTLLWEVVESMGGRETEHEYKVGGRRERMWSVPRSAVE